MCRELFWPAQLSCPGQLWGKAPSQPSLVCPGDTCRDRDGNCTVWKFLLALRLPLWIKCCKKVRGDRAESLQEGSA